MVAGIGEAMAAVKAQGIGPESTPDPANWCTELSRPVTE
jgi:hypothetical protein